MIGVMVSQSYDAKQGYSQEQIELFEVIALYLATAIERVKKRELLESQVKQRTQALTLSNQALNDEITNKKSFRTTANVVPNIGTGEPVDQY